MSTHPVRLLLLSLSIILGSAAEANPPAAGEAPASAQDDLFNIGQALFDAYAPPEIKAEYAFPTREQWDEFAARLEKTAETGTMAEFAAYEDEVRAAVLVLRNLPDYRDYAEWLEARLDEIVVARQASTSVPAPDDPAPQRPPPTPPLLAPVASADAVPLYELWVTRISERPRPPRADEFLVDLKKIFVAEGLPAELVWLAETESTFNPRAVSPAGARGMFQIMPATAKGLGMSLLPFDERNNPEKSARAAATLLRRLHGLFDSWPLALAAYNAGEGRVGRTLKAHNATTFAQIADALPTETRLYVPKVLATLAVREGLALGTLAPPR